MLPDTRFALEDKDMTREQLESLARGQAKVHGLHEGIFLALVQQESSWNPRAKNARSGCVGLCQLNPRFFAELDGTPYTEEELFIPELNLWLGARHLREGLNVSGGSYFTALVIYNWGIGNVLYWKRKLGAEWVTKIPSETRLYVRIILLRPMED